MMITHRASVPSSAAQPTAEGCGGTGSGDTGPSSSQTRLGFPVKILAGISPGKIGPQGSPAEAAGFASGGGAFALFFARLMLARIWPASLVQVRAWVAVPVINKSSDGVVSAPGGNLDARSSPGVPGVLVRRVRAAGRPGVGGAGRGSSAAGSR